MKKISSTTPITLIELIVSALLVAIVILGICSINMVLSNNNQDYGQRYLVKSESQLILNHILNNAALAVGTAGTDQFGNSNIGIEIGPGSAQWGSAQIDESICIHQAGKSTPGGQNLANWPFDIWACYTWYPLGDTDPSYEIKYCAMPYVSSAITGDLRQAFNCEFAPVPIPINGVRGPIVLGTSNTDFANNATFIANGTQLLFSLTIQNCLNNTALSCNGNGLIPGLTPGHSSDEANNPEAKVSGSVVPAQESM
jgi:hypothetical protein